MLNVVLVCGEKIKKCGFRIFFPKSYKLPRYLRFLCLHLVFEYVRPGGCIKIEIFEHVRPGGCIKIEVFEHVRPGGCIKIEVFEHVRPGGCIKIEVFERKKVRHHGCIKINQYLSIDEALVEFQLR